MTHQITCDTPIGPMTFRQDGDAIVSLSWETAEHQNPTPLLRRAAAQLKEYFAGSRTDFDLPLAPRGSDFQRAICDAMLRIPYGKTRTYGDLAADLDSAPRAVGMACGRNPIPIVIPCHRVVGANGNLTGYSGGKGVDTKSFLLRLEGVEPAQTTLFPMTR